MVPRPEFTPLYAGPGASLSFFLTRFFFDPFCKSLLVEAHPRPSAAAYVNPRRLPRRLVRPRALAIAIFFTRLGMVT